MSYNRHGEFVSIDDTVTTSTEDRYLKPRDELQYLFDAVNE
jgi:hypothetical protein